MLAVVVVLTLVALITDRRAILVAALSYTAIAFGSLIRDAGLANPLAALEPAHAGRPRPAAQRRLAPG